MLTEEILEPPLEYGLYDWLLTSGVLRYCLAEPALERHRQQVQGVMAQYSGRDDLLALIAPFVSERRIFTPLLWPKNHQPTPTNRRPTHEINGYLDLHRLWIRRLTLIRAGNSQNPAIASRLVTPAYLGG